MGMLEVAALCTRRMGSNNYDMCIKTRTQFCSRRYSYYLRPLQANSEYPTEGNPTDRKEDTSTTSLSSLNSSLNSLDSYFNKLQGVSNTRNTFKPSSGRAEGLNAINAYLDNMQTPAKAIPTNEEDKPSKDNGDEKLLSFFVDLGGTFSTNIPKSASTFTNIFIGLNIAVFLFGLASPVQTPEMVELPLPVVYGAKVNSLIIDGQWWRLITPMFLHDGLIHIGLSAWTLLSFGPVVEYVYGSTGFCMIYLLGGIFGNLASFLHTTAPTVSGTGPLYALVAAWAAYVIQNRNVFSKEMQASIANDVIQKIIIMSALHLALTDALPADNWTHIGATLAGLFFGLIATPKAMNARLEEFDNKMVFAQAPDIQKLTVAFTLCLGIYLFIYCLVVFMEHVLVLVVVCLVTGVIGRELKLPSYNQNDYPLGKPYANPNQQYHFALNCLRNQSSEYPCPILDDKGKINNITSMESYCGICSTQTMVVLNCIDIVINRFRFENNATTNDVRNAINEGCTTGKQPS